MIDTSKAISGVVVNGTSMNVGDLTTKTITENGTYNASSDGYDGYSSVTVNVSGGGGATYTVTYNLLNVTSTTSVNQVPANGCFGTILIPDDTMDLLTSFSVRMGGSYYYAGVREATQDGEYIIVIPQVTGNIVITAEQDLEEPEE